MFLFDGGYANIRSTGLSWHYYVKDHLDSNRIIQSESGVVETSYNYYPFGGKYEHYAELYGYNQSSQPYKYNGKEYDPMHGLDLYDYGARMYDPLLARWTAIDPMAAKTPQVSPYAYCRNNPVRFTDPNGKDDVDKIFGFAIGIVTNIIPNSGGWRDGYSAMDLGDYNAGLKIADVTSTIVGSALVADGVKNIGYGAGLSATSLTVTAATGGTAAPATALTGTVGGAIAAEGLAEATAGSIMLTNTSKNSSKGYNRGKLGTPKDAANLSATNRDRLPKDIDRVDRAHDTKTGQIHAHHKKGGATNADGSVHDKSKGIPNWSKKTKEWLKDFGFQL